MAFSPSPAQILRRKRVLTLIAVVLVGSCWLRSASFPKPNFSHSEPHPQSTGPLDANVDLASSTSCRSLPGAENVVVVFKTGASEIYEKLPEHFITLLRCAPNSLIFSDVEQHIGDYYAHDVLAEVSEHVRETQPEFQYYRQINRLAADGQHLAMLKGNKAWDLDKWKFLPMVRAAYRMYPKMKWFFFIEGDTAVIWTNLLQWLNRLQPNDLIYSGSQNVLGGITFAHGGSGILVSQAAMKKLEDSYPRYKTQWENDTSNTCCGDAFLAKAFLDSGVPMTPSFPLIQGETPGTIDWNARHMCAPAVTWHHVTAMDIDSLWHVQQNWTARQGFQKPLLFRDLFNRFVSNRIRDRREAWDNISEDWRYSKSDVSSSRWEKLSDTEKRSVDSFEDCREACRQNDACLQFKYKRGTCSLGRDIRIGRADGDFGDDEVSEATASGWLLGRIARFRAGFENCEANWDFNQ